MSDISKENPKEKFEDLVVQLKKKSKLIRQQNKRFRKAKTIVTQYKEYQKLQTILKEWEKLATKMRTTRKNFPVK
jgi:hypothetical protein